MASNRQYFRSEQEIAKLLSSSGLPIQFRDQFTKDYAALKGDMGGSDEQIKQLQKDVTNLEFRVGNTESSIATINTDLSALGNSVIQITLQVAEIDDRLLIAELDLSDLSDDFYVHRSSSIAHGSNGDIVGTDDFCTATVGGTVLLASALTPNANSTLIITSFIDPPLVAYNQSVATSWTNALNEIKADFNALVLEYNQLVAKVNSIISTQETAKQRDI